MNKQRKVLVTVTYNELGIIIDTKTEELDSSAQPVIRTEMSSANDTIYRQEAKLKVAKVIWEDGDSCYDFHDKCVDCLNDVPSEQPEIIRCKDCRWREGSECVRFADVRPFPDDYCSRAERREDE